VTDRCYCIEIHQFCVADGTFKGRLVAKCLVLLAGAFVVFWHQTEVVHTGPSGVEELFVNGGFVVVLKYEFDLYITAITER